MWLVIFKENHYPSVYEFSTEEEANKKYDELKKYVREDDDEEKLYLAKVEKSLGNLNRDIDWRCG